MTEIPASTNDNKHSGRKRRKTNRALNHSISVLRFHLETSVLIIPAIGTVSNRTAAAQTTKFIEVDGYASMKLGLYSKKTVLIRRFTQTQLGKMLLNTSANYPLTKVYFPSGLFLLYGLNDHFCCI